MSFKLLVISFFLVSSICMADTNSSQSGPLFGDIDGTNAGRYRSVKFTNGSTTNNSDGSVTVTTGGAGGTPSAPVNSVQYNNAGSFGGSANFQFDGVNVGIGTFKPSTQLEQVASDSGTTITAASAAMHGIVNSNTTDNNFGDLAFGQVNLGNSVSYTSKITGVQTSHTVGSESGALAFLTVNAGVAAERMRLISNGNLGIGTAIPPDTIYVAGSGQFTGQLKLSTAGISLGTSAVMIGTTGTGTNIVTSQSPTLGGTLTVPIIRGTTSASNGIILEATTGNSPTVASNLQIFNTTGTGTRIALNVDNASNIGLGTVGPSSNQLAIVGGVGVGINGASSYVNTLSAPVGGMIVEGNVGIGTSVTPYKLDLTVNSTTPVRFQTTGQSLPNTLTLEGAGNGAVNRGSSLLFNVPVTSNPVNGVRIAAGEEVNTGTAYMSIETGTAGTLSEKMRVTSSGNVGIGTINPLSKFIVTGGGVGVGTNINSAFIQSSAPNGGMLVEGNVGIGTVSPNAILNVVSTANVPQFRVDDDGANDASPFVVDANGNVGIGTSVTQTDKLLVMGGNVGIGTWVPSTTFDVQGGVNISGNVGIGTFVAPNQSALLNIATTNNQTLFRIDDNGIGDPTPFIVDANGNVGVGTLNPSASLNVGGNIYIDRTTSTIIFKDSGGAGGCTKITGNLGTLTAATVACP